MFIIFQTGGYGTAKGLLGLHKPGLPSKEQHFHELGEGTAHDNVAQQPLKAA